jgi:carboxymethylenebutenolidase
VATREYLAEEIALDYSDAILTRREALRRLGLLGLTASAAAALLAACGGDGDGYSALAIDLLSEEGGTAAVGGEAEATAALGQAAPERLIADLRAGIDELERRDRNAKLAVIGFCFGGGLTWQLLAAGEPRLAAGAPFYGPAPASPDFSGSKGVFAVSAELDSRVNATRDGAVAALEAAGLTHEVRTFPGVDHAFFNDTGPSYNAAAASEAYQAVLSWFATHVA